MVEGFVLAVDHRVSESAFDHNLDSAHLVSSATN